MILTVSADGKKYLYGRNGMFLGEAQDRACHTSPLCSASSEPAAHKGWGEDRAMSSPGGRMEEGPNSDLARDVWLAGDLLPRP